MSSWQLASLDILGSEDELQAAARNESIAPPGAAEIVGSDASHAVSVRMDRTGRVVDVAIDDDWRDAVQVGELGPALIEAYGSACRHVSALQLDDGAAATSAAELPGHSESSGPLESSGLSESSGPSGPLEPVGHDDADWMRSLRARLGEVTRTLDDSSRAWRDVAAGPEREVRGPEGLVVLSVRGQEVRAATISVRAAMQESPSRLAADALGAFRAIDN